MFSSMGNVTSRWLGKRCFRWVCSADAQVQRTLRDERRLTGAIVCVIAKSAILISAQFNILPHYSLWSKIKSPCP